MAAECSVPQLVVGDTKRGWGKYLSKGLLLIGGREQIISLVLVIFQGTWQELLGDISSYLAGDKSFTFQLRFPTDKITSTEVINTDVISVMRTASTKIFQVCAISGLAKKKKRQQNTLHWRCCLKTLASCHVYKECSLFLLPFYPKVNHTCLSWFTQKERTCGVKYRRKSGLSVFWRLFARVSKSKQLIRVVMGHTENTFQCYWMFYSFILYRNKTSLPLVFFPQYMASPFCTLSPRVALQMCFVRITQSHWVPN